VLWRIKPSAGWRFVLSALLLAPLYQVLGAAAARAQSYDLRPIVQPNEKTKLRSSHGRGRFATRQ
jgi:hypothetical protein